MNNINKETNTMSHIMIDLETMGTRPDAPIVAIGAVAFDANGVSDRFYRAVDLKSSVESGAVIDSSTVMWWLQQSDSARAALSRSALPLQKALQDFADWYLTSAGSEVWGNGATFDNVILSESYLRCQLKRPWSYSKDRCYRTIKEAAPHVSLVRSGTHHNALDDAESQANHLIAIWKQD